MAKKRDRAPRQPPGIHQGRVREIVVKPEQHAALTRALAEAEQRFAVANALASGILTGFGVKAAVNVQVLPGNRLRFVEVPAPPEATPA